jgi:hypothetical protein
LMMPKDYKHHQKGQFDIFKPRQYIHIDMSPPYMDANRCQ